MYQFERLGPHEVTDRFTVFSKDLELRKEAIYNM